MVESSAHLTGDKFFEISPYTVKSQKAYNSSYLAGYCADYYDKDVNECYVTAKDMINQTIRSKILSKYDYDRVRELNVTTNYMSPMFKYILLPIYFFVFNYKGKVYTMYMNGETARLGGRVPRSALKIIRFILLIILGLLAFFALSLLPALPAIFNHY